MQSKRSKSSASVLHTPKVPRVAVLVDTSSSWGRRIIRGIDNYALKNGPWQLFLEARGLEDDYGLPPGWHGDGIIARIGSSRMAEEIAALRLPTINVSNIIVPKNYFPRVSTDLTVSAQLAVEHFLDRGFRSFAYFSLVGLSYDSAQREAFTSALRDAGHACSTYSVKPRKGAEPDWSLDLVELSNWLKSLPKPVGVLAWNASSSREVVYACQLADLLIPEEVAVLSGSDDDMLCECVHPAISGIMAAAESIGHHAAELLDQLMTRSKRKVKSLRIPPQKITPRQSTDTLAIQDPALVKALGFIRQNAAQPIQVNDVAQHAGISRRILELRFMQHLKRSPAMEIRRSHLDRAKRLLAETEMPIPDVAEAAGFGSSEYFASAFKLNTGVSPLQFRKSIRK